MTNAINRTATLVVGLVCALTIALTSGDNAANAERTHIGTPLSGAVEVECGKRLHLRELEDGSAWLLCGKRVIVKVGVRGR